MKEGACRSAAGNKRVVMERRPTQSKAIRAHPRIETISATVLIRTGPRSQEEDRVNSQKKLAVIGGFVAGAALGAATAAWRDHRQLSQDRAAQDDVELDAADGGRPPARRCFAEIDGTRMSWLEQGVGAPVVLLHGIPTSPELWRYVMPRLRGVRVLAWEMVGYGMSIAEGRGRDISIGQQAEYLASWMRHLGIDRAVIAGHDLGGGVAQIAAIRYPELCGGLFLTNAIGYDSWPIPSVKAMKASAGLMRNLPRPVFKLLLMNLFTRGHDDPAKAKAAYAVHGDGYLRAGGAAALIRQIEFLNVHDTLAISDQLPSLGIPARLVWGDADRFQPAEYGKRFSRDLSAPLRTIVGGKHFTPEDHPDIVAEEIMALVRVVHPTDELASAYDSMRLGETDDSRNLERPSAGSLRSDDRG